MKTQIPTTELPGQDVLARTDTAFPWRTGNCILRFSDFMRGLQVVVMGDNCAFQLVRGQFRGILWQTLCNFRAGAS